LPGGIADAIISSVYLINLTVILVIVYVAMFCDCTCMYVCSRSDRLLALIYLNKYLLLLLTQIDPFKATGPDDIPPKLLKRWHLSCLLV